MYYFIKYNCGELLYNFFQYDDEEISSAVINVFGEIARSDYYDLFPAYDLLAVMPVNLLNTKDGNLLTNIIAILFVSYLHGYGKSNFQKKEKLDYFISLYQYHFAPLLYFVSELLKVAITPDSIYYLFLDWDLVKDSIRKNISASVLLLSSHKEVQLKTIDLLEDEIVNSILKLFNR